MLDTGLLNFTLYNANPIPFVSTDSTDSIRFDGFGLQHCNETEKIVMDQPQYDIPANRVTDSFKKPRADGFGENTDYRGIKKIRLRGTLVVQTNEQLERLIDSINNQLDVPEGNLDILRADGLTYRRWYCKPQIKTGFRDKNYHIVWCPIEIDFDVLKSYGQDINYVSSGKVIKYLEITETQLNSSVGKTIKAPAVFVMIINEATNVSKVNIENISTGRQVEVDVSLKAGDILVFDSERYEIFNLSGGSRQKLKSRGDFLTFKQGQNSYKISVTGDSIRYTLTAKHINLYV